MASAQRVAPRVDHGRHRPDLRSAAHRLRRRRPTLRTRSRAAVSHGAARPPRRLRARRSCVGEAVSGHRGRVPAQGPHVRALLADRSPRQDAAPPRPHLLAGDPVAPPSPLRERVAAPDLARRFARLGARGPRLRHRPRGAVAAAPGRCAGRRDRPLLRACHIGDRRVARAVSPLRRARGLGKSRRHAMNRLLDATLAGFGLAVASPALAAAAVAIKLDDGGPVLYRQRRVGLRGTDFELVKLRTMRVGAEREGAGYAVNEGDPRITRVGRVLRRLSLDELPQLWNVVRGDMSLVGPRPTLAYQVEKYTPRQRRRLDVKPGITGWAQVHGRARLPWDERIELDVWYVEHRSPWVDLKILARTPAALCGGTYKGETGGWTRCFRSSAARTCEPP